MSIEPGIARPETARSWLSRKLDVVAALIAVSGVLNAAGALFILHVYDNAIPDHSLTALALAFAAVVAVYVFQSGLRFIARRKAENVSALYLARFEPPALMEFQRSTQSAIAEAHLVDIRKFARFLRSRRLFVVLDLTWAPFFLACLFYVSPVIGLFSIIILALLTLATWRLQPKIAPTILTKEQRRTHTSAPDHRVHLLGAVASTLKNIAHSGVLAVGAWLVITERLEIGELMASSMLMMRLFSPARALADEWQDLRHIKPIWLRLRDVEWPLIRAPHFDSNALPILPKGCDELGSNAKGETGAR